MNKSEIIEPFEPTNMSVPNCNFQDDYQGYDSKPFKYSKTPQNNTGYSILNPNSVQNKYVSDFDKIKVDGKDAYITSIQDGSVKSNMHNGQYTIVDVPYRDSGVSLNQMDKIYTDKFLNNYSTGYKNYSEIEGGDIIYYVNKSNQEPFFSPIFSESSDFNTTSIMYKDPMGSLKPQYIRHSNKPTNKINERINFDSGLSWIEDTNEHREDLLARNIQKLNQNRWDARWSN
jgi:hypothetical protein